MSPALPSPYMKLNKSLGPRLKNFNLTPCSKLSFKLGVYFLHHALTITQVTWYGHISAIRIRIFKYNCKTIVFWSDNKSFKFWVSSMEFISKFLTSGPGVGKLMHAICDNSLFVQSRGIIHLSVSVQFPALNRCKQCGPRQPSSHEINIRTNLKTFYFSKILILRLDIVAKMWSRLMSPMAVEGLS